MFLQHNRYFNLGWKVFTRPPFYTWHEGNATEGSSGQGVPMDDTVLFAQTISSCIELQ